MLQCKFCQSGEVNDFGDEVDFYTCEECKSTTCHMCIETSIKTGHDYCFYCKNNLQWEGKWK